jgi:hypothetical protein
MPSWPNPHPWAGSPLDDEYSRVTAPERYAIVHARARAWTDALGDLPGVEVETLPPGTGDDGDDGDAGGTERFDRGVRITSSRTGTLPLLLLEHDTPLAMLTVAIVEPRVVVERQPACGCDACDSGSADLLDAIDERIGAVVSGPYVLLRRPGWHAEWHPGGGSSGSSGGTPPLPDPAEAIRWCRRLAAGEDVRLPPGTEAFVGRSWFDRTRPAEPAPRT